MSTAPEMSTKRLAVMGLVYVDLPLAVEFGKAHQVTGFEINPRRIDKPSKCHYGTKEVTPRELTEAKGLTMTFEPDALREFGVTVQVADLQADAEEAQHEFGITLVPPEQGAFEAVILALPHREVVEQGVDALRAHGKEGHVFNHMKAVYPADASDLRL